MSKEAKEDQKSRVLSKLDPVEVIDINGVAVEVAPLNWKKNCEAIEFLWDFFEVAGKGELDKAFLMKSEVTLRRFLSLCVTVVDAHEIKVEDLSPKIIWKLLDVFLEHTFDPGNFQTLTQKWKERLGISVLSINPAGQGLSSTPMKISQPSSSTKDMDGEKS